MRARKVDDTHNGIARALRNAGVSVFDSSAIGRGFPDLVISFGGFTALCECKTGKKDLRESQREFINKWAGSVIVARAGDEAVNEFFKAYAVHVLGKL